MTIQQVWEWYRDNEGLNDLDSDEIELYRAIFFSGAAALVASVRMAKESNTLDSMMVRLDRELHEFQDGGDIDVSRLN